MRPPFFIGACLVFWGFMTEIPAAGIAAACILESSFLMKRKKEFTLAEYTTLSDLSTILVIVSLLLMMLTYEREDIIFNFFKWYPAAVFPIMIAQYYGHDEKVIIATRFGKKKRSAPFMHKPLTITPHYAAICVLSAAIYNNRTPLFFIGTVVLVVWGLWTFPSRRYSVPARIGVAILILIAGILIHNGYDYTRRWMWDQFMDYARNHRFRSFRGDVSHTSIGDLGKIKQSDMIVLRVTPKQKGAPFYIRRNTYSIYRRESWYVPKIEQKALVLSDDAWEVIETTEPNNIREMSIQAFIPSGRRRYIPIPRGAYSITKLSVADLSRDEYGTLSFLEGPSFADFTVEYSFDIAFEGLPKVDDLSIPPNEKRVFQTVAQNAGLMTATTAQEAVDLVERFFQDYFSYSLTQEQVPKGMTPLENFLTRRKQGHCEYYATATVLLLRTAGVPARYVTGYYVSEYSKFEKKYIARVRHGHAWVTAYVGGKWIEIDTTPPAWFTEEDRNANSILRPVKDFFSYIRAQYLLLSTTKSDVLNRYLAIAVAALAAFLVYRIYRRARKKPAFERVKKRYPGMDSLFYSVEKQLMQLNIPRPGHMTLQRWLYLLKERGVLTDTSTLETLLRLHYRLRFDPKGLTDEEYNEFVKLAKEWLLSFQNSVKKT